MYFLLVLVQLFAVFTTSPLVKMFLTDDTPKNCMQYMVYTVLSSKNEISKIKLKFLHTSFVTFLLDKTWERVASSQHWAASIDKYLLRVGLHADGLYAESLKYRDLSEM